MGINEPLMEFKGKTALITGASTGIGSATAQALCAQGARVILVARRGKLLDQVAGQCVSLPGSALTMPCDLTDVPGIDALFSQLKKSGIQIDLLVNGAGRELLAPLQTSSSKDIQELTDLNILAPIHMIQQSLLQMKRGSAVVNVASAAGLAGSPGMAVYAATKAALISLTRSLARETASRGIRVNAVAPGIVRTELTDRMFKDLTPDQVRAIEKRHPLGFGKPEDVAQAIVFLCSVKARWITGQVLVVDGGYSA